MADLESSLWSETAASNTAPSPDGWPPNSSPNIVYTTDREIMGSLKRDWNRRNAAVTSGGSANAQTLTYTQNPTAMVRGQRYAFIAGFANTGPMTLAVGGLAATAVQVSGAALVGGELKVGLITEVIYDGTVFEIIAGSGAGSGALLPLKGVTDGSNAAAGIVGEIITNSGSGTLTNASPFTLTTISLTAGDWDVWGEVDFSVGTGGATSLNGWMNTAAAFGGTKFALNLAFPASNSQYHPVGVMRVSIASTTTIYLGAQANFPSGTTTSNGIITARRAR